MKMSEMRAEEVKLYKAALVRAVENEDIKQIASATVAFAERKSEYWTWLGIDHWILNGLTIEQCKEQLIKKLLRGADDSWSGRTNDVLRAEFDGFRRAADRFLSNNWSVVDGQLVMEK